MPITPSQTAKDQWLSAISAFLDAHVSSDSRMEACEELSDICAKYLDYYNEFRSSHS